MSAGEYDGVIAYARAKRVQVSCVLAGGTGQSKESLCTQCTLVGRIPPESLEGCHAFIES